MVRQPLFNDYHMIKEYKPLFKNSPSLVTLTPLSIDHSWANKEIVENITQYINIFRTMDQPVSVKSRVSSDIVDKHFVPFSFPENKDK